MNDALTRLILVSLGLLAVLAAVSVFHAPAYEAGVRIAFETLKDILIAATSAKFGLTLPRRDEEDK